MPWINTPKTVARSSNYRSGTHTSSDGYKRQGISKYRKRKRTGSRFARKVISIMNSRQEKKFFSIYATRFAPPTGTVATNFSLSEVTQGDGDTNRDGDQFYVTSIQMKYHYLGNPAYSTNVQYVRIILFQWTDSIASATVPSIQAILLDVSSNDAAVVSPYNHDTRYNFRILYDKTHGIGLASTTMPPQTFNESVIITKGFTPKVQLEATGTGGTNKFYMLITGTAATNPGILSVHTKVNFKDN